jgi:hypothetical protein
MTYFIELPFQVPYRNLVPVEGEPGNHVATTMADLIVRASCFFFQQMRWQQQQKAAEIGHGTMKSYIYL